MRENRVVDIRGFVRGETEKAWRFQPEDIEVGAGHVWLPKSQCEWYEEDQTMVIPEWLAKEKELI
jgi:hypothetical protein